MPIIPIPVTLALGALYVLVLIVGRAIERHLAK